MRRIRVIPTLLIQNGGLVKTIKFKSPQYIGDPINAVRIFNEKEVDEIVILDISATKERRGPNISQIAEIASEAFMPMGYGGGITKIEEIQQILHNGVEKVVLNSAVPNNMALVTQSANMCGSSSTVVSIDFSKNWLGKYKVYTENGKNNTGLDPIQYAKDLENAGAGELFLNNIDRDGTYTGYDIDLIHKISHAVGVPVVVCGGASKVADFTDAIKNGGASAVAAGSLFVFQSATRGILINYPNQKILKEEVFSKI